MASRIVYYMILILHYFLPDAPVFSPVDGSKWLLAKQELNRADVMHAELIEHLLKTHILMEPICVIMRRTLSIYHPLHQILKWHCRGLFVVNSLGLEALLAPEGLVHKLFAIGHEGSVEFLNKAYPYVSWADTEFDKNLEVTVIYFYPRYLQYTLYKVPLKTEYQPRLS